MDAMLRVKIGMAGLLVFELVLAAYLLSRGLLDYTIMALAAAGSLVYAWNEFARTRRVGAAALGVLAVVTLVRALAQTPAAGFPAVLPSYLVAVGFGVAAYAASVPGAALASRGGIALVAICRTWFAASYLTAGVPYIALANVFGAVGSWVWASAEGTETGLDAAASGAEA